MIIYSSHRGTALTVPPPLLPPAVASCYVQRRCLAARAASSPTSSLTATAPPPHPPSHHQITWPLLPEKEDQYDNDEELRSTWVHRVYVAAGAAAILSSFSATVSAVSSSADLLETVLAAAAGYSFSDLVTGVYHWAIDNYGSAATPFFGGQIAGFMDHHDHPYKITRTELCNNLHELGRAVAVMVPVVDLVIPDGSAGAHAFLTALAACLMLSQQFHAWSHERPRRVPRLVAALQRSGILVSRAEHGAHHRQPFNAHYCIISGMWNGLLDRSKVWEAMELIIFFLFGVRPRCWGGHAVSDNEDDHVVDEKEGAERGGRAVESHSMR